MLRILIVLLLSFTYLKSEWIEEGDYLKLNHDMTNISEMRYSIDTTHIILINSEKINYYNKYSGEFSKSFSSPHFLGQLIDTLVFFSDPLLSINEKYITYTNTFIEPYNFCLNIEEAYFDIENKDVIYTGCKGFDSFVWIKWGNFDSFLIAESINDKLKYNYHYIDIGFSSVKIERSLKNTLTSPSSIRIENINSNIKYNPLNNAIAEKRGRLIIVQSGEVFGKNFGSNIDEYNHYFDSLKIVEQVLTFAHDEKHIFVVEKNNNVLNKYDYINDEDNYIEGDFNYSKVYYLSDNKFLGQNSKDFYVLDGDSLSKLFKFSIKNESSVSFFDSTNHSFYFLSKDNIYKNNLNLNTLKTKNKEIHTISVINNLIISNNNIDEVYIYDLLGSNVISEENYTGTVFHLNSLNPGLYLYRVKSGNKYYSNKFIIEK